MTRLSIAAGAEIPRTKEPKFQRAAWSPFILVFCAEPAAGHRELHSRIDALVESAAIGPLAPVCSDADFVRRVYLDLTGVIPTADQARSFLDDRKSGKRERLIEELVTSPAFA